MLKMLFEREDGNVAGWLSEEAWHRRAIQWSHVEEKWVRNRLVYELATQHEENFLLSLPMRIQLFRNSHGNEGFATVDTRGRPCEDEQGDWGEGLNGQNEESFSAFINRNFFGFWHSQQPLRIWKGWEMIMVGRKYSMRNGWAKNRRSVYCTHNSERHEEMDSSSSSSVWVNCYLKDPGWDFVRLFFDVNSILQRKEIVQDGVPPTVFSTLAGSLTAVIYWSLISIVWSLI